MLSGTLSAETIKNKELELLNSKTKLIELLEIDNNKLNSLPDVTTIKLEADTIRRQLLERFSGKDRLSEMSFEDKHQLLHWLFDEQDEEGTPYGIYIIKTEKRGKSKIDYYMYCKIKGLRTLKGDNINYQEEDTDEYTTNNKVMKI